MSGGVGEWSGRRSPRLRAPSFRLRGWLGAARWPALAR